MSNETNKKIVTDFITRLFSEGDLGAVDAYLSQDYVDHDPPFGSDGSREGMRGAAVLCRQACPDWLSELHFLVAEDDKVVELFTASGTHRGEIMGVAPTGQRLVLKGINVFRLRDQQIVERWGRLDDLGFLQQLGLAPAP